MIYHVYATKSNIGDWLSAKGIQSLLKPVEVHELFCDSPYVEETLSVLSKVTPQDFIVIGGGGLLMDYFEGFWEGFRSIANRVPFALWGVGCCDLKRENTSVSKDLMTGIVRQSRLCVVRDRLTWDFFTNKSLPDPVPCPSLSVIERREGPGRGLLHAAHAGIVDPETHQEICGILKELAGKSGRPYWETRNRIEPKARNLQLELDKYRNSDVVISSRLHGCIIAVGMGNKVIALSGDRKIDHFMDSAGLGEWVLEIDEIGRLPEMLAGLEKQESPGAFVDRVRQDHLTISEKIKSLIEDAKKASHHRTGAVLF
jgi:polysaccharide pyruvyl transferase WcaK-like protein